MPPAREFPVGFRVCAARERQRGAVKPSIISPASSAYVLTYTHRRIYRGVATVVRVCGCARSSRLVVSVGWPSEQHRQGSAEVAEPTKRCVASRRTFLKCVCSEKYRRSHQHISREDKYSGVDTSRERESVYRLEERIKRAGRWFGPRAIDMFVAAAAAATARITCEYR